MCLRVVFILVCGHLVLAADRYSVPEPNIEAFSPKGIRISIPDAPSIKSVQFFLAFTRNMDIDEPARVSKEVDDKQGSYWMFYHPGIAIRPGELVNYTITVNHNGQQYTKKGSQQVNKVLSTADTHADIRIEDCEDEGQQHLVNFPHTQDIHASTTGEVKSAYSMYKSTESKPITRSSTTTTSGSFFVKPTGEVDASGFRSASSFDSTKPDGEQWLHSKTDLSAADIEELKRLHGQDFYTMPAFAGLHGGSSGSYRQSSYSSSTSSQSRPVYGGSGSYHQMGQVSETLPIVPPPSSSGFTSYSKFEKHESSLPTIIHPGYSSLSTSNTLQSASNPQNTFSFPAGHQEYEQPKPTYASSSNVQSYIKDTRGTPVKAIPSGGATTQVTKEHYEYNAPKNTILVPVPLSSRPQVTYNGEIFRTSGQPTNPTSCAATHYSYKTASQIDVVALERSLQEMQCLAVLAENTMKAEVYALKEANTNLVNRLNDLDAQFQRFRSECKCGY